MASTIDNTQL